MQVYSQFPCSFEFTEKLLVLLALVQSSTTNLPEECLTTGPGPPSTNRTRVMLGYLTDVTGMPGRQVSGDISGLTDLGLLRTRLLGLRFLLRTQKIMTSLRIHFFKLSNTIKIGTNMPRVRNTITCKY